jgi:hypothetical protein
MSNDFVLLPRNPNPTEVMEVIIKLAPDFKAYWDKSDNYSREKDGSFSLHGLFSEFGGYIRDAFPHIDKKVRKELFAFIENCAVTDMHSESGVSNAVCTCFLENLAGEGELSEAILSYLGPQSRKYFDQ